MSRRSVGQRINRTGPTWYEQVLLGCVLMTTARETAATFGVSVQTVKNVMTDLYAKLGVSTARQAAAALGWLVVPPAILAEIERQEGSVTLPISGSQTSFGAPTMDAS